MTFKEIIISLYKGKYMFVGQHKVYFIQNKDFPIEEFNKIKSKLKEEGFEIKGSNPDFEKGDDRNYYPYIEVVQKQQENKKLKMKKSEAVKFIKEQILSSLSEKKKSTKKKEEPSEEESETSEEETTDENPEGEESATNTGGDTKAIQSALTKLQDTAKGLGDEKLNLQISNLITYYTRNYVSKGQ